MEQQNNRDMHSSLFGKMEDIETPEPSSIYDMYRLCDVVAGRSNKPKEEKIESLESWLDSIASETSSSKDYERHGRASLLIIGSLLGKSSAYKNLGMKAADAIGRAVHEQLKREIEFYASQEEHIERLSASHVDYTKQRLRRIIEIEAQYLADKKDELIMSANRLADVFYSYAARIGYAKVQVKKMLAKDRQKIL